MTELDEAVDAFAVEMKKRLRAKSKQGALSASRSRAMADLPPLPNSLIDAVGAYWACAFREGQEGRTFDTTDGAAQSAWTELQAAMRAYAAAAVAAEREACAKLCESMTAHKRVIRAGVNSEPMKECGIAAAIRARGPSNG